MGVRRGQERTRWRAKRLTNAIAFAFGQGGVWRVPARNIRLQRTVVDKNVRPQLAVLRRSL
jgi:hypothetical protein